MTPTAGTGPRPALRLDLNIGTTWLLPTWSAGPQGGDDAALEAACSAGYAGMQGLDAQRCREVGLVPTTFDIWPWSGGMLEKARRWADAGYLCSTVMLGTGMDDDDQCARLVDELLEASTTAGIPIYVETHRGTITQDIWRTLGLVERYPELRFNGDFSHWYTAHDMPMGDFAAKVDAIGPVLDRVRYLHGRIGTAGCIQVDVGDGSSEGRPHVEHFRMMWTRSFAGFIATAHLDPVPVADLTIGFAPELLAAEFGCARTVPGPDGTQVEECDRWTQALVLARIATECFATAEASTTG